jgi:N-acetylgalactosamine-N,N'-diacetylbacillosaminyl-diphospho-undecaprenol 4-alpha-N-acetylgalactosaminyltransferase
LFILGTGPLKERLIEYARRIELIACDCSGDKPVDIHADVFFGGFHQNPFKFIGRSKVFVLTSETEGLPTVILEALACGVPVISVDCPSGPREILAPESLFNFQLNDKVEFAKFGILVPINNVESLTNSLKMVLTNEDLYLGYINASKLRAHDFSYDALVEEYAKVLN